MNKQIDLTKLHIIYENKGKEKELDKCKKINKQIDWLDFIFNMKLKEK